MKTVFSVINKTDQNLFLTISRLQTGWQNICFLFLTTLGGVYVQTFLTLFFIVLPPTRSAAVQYGIIQLIVTANVQVLKHTVSRVRPYNTLADIIPLRTEKDASFPSGHTAAAFSAAVFMNALVPGISFICFAPAILIGYSRVYIGVHYPSDVIAGGLIGLSITEIILSYLS